MNRRGYTVVEVMMSLAVLGVGASGVIAMQKATLIGNTNARNIAAANAVAQSWVERLRTEALQWNAPGGTDDLATDTQWLKLWAAHPQATDWFNPAQILLKGTSPSGSPVADVLGGDLYQNDPGQPAFCTKMRLMRLLMYPDPKIQVPTTTRTIRAEVRVYWERSGQPVNCSSVPDPETGDNTRYGFVSLVAAVGQMTAQ